MRKNHVLRLGALALAVSLITIGMMGTTLARYAGEVDGTGEVKVASWNVVLGSGSDETFNLAGTRTTNGGEYVAADVVAPGDEGELKFKISDGGSQVAYKYSIVLDTTGLGDSLNGKIKFYTDAAHQTLWTDLENVEVKVGADGKTAELKKEGTIYWEWADDNDDVANPSDTELGVTPPTDATFTIKMTAEQLFETAPTP